MAPSTTCKTCEHFAPLMPGQAAICFERWSHLPWNAAVPLTTDDDTCEQHKPKRHRDVATAAAVMGSE